MPSTALYARTSAGYQADSDGHSTSTARPTRDSIASTGGSAAAAAAPSPPPPPVRPSWRGLRRSQLSASRVACSRSGGDTSVSGASTAGSNGASVAGVAASTDSPSGTPKNLTRRAPPGAGAAPLPPLALPPLPPPLPLASGETPLPAFGLLGDLGLGGSTAAAADDDGAPAAGSGVSRWKVRAGHGTPAAARGAWQRPPPTHTRATAVFGGATATHTAVVRPASAICTQRAPAARCGSAWRASTTTPARGGAPSFSA